MLRTEPWQAPVAISASGAPSALPVVAGKRIRYTLSSARISIELPARKKKPSGTLEHVEGFIELDPAQPENTRATLKADLHSLSLSSNGREPSPQLLARAFDWLEISGSGGEARESNRYAVLDIVGFDPPPISDDARSGRPVSVVARGNLTLHHFRVPVTLELELQLKSATASDPSTLAIRTRRPLVVSLVAHDIMPRDAHGGLVPDGVRSLGTEVGREARVSAELTARAAADEPEKQ
ncbi:MAG: hypothetical protein QM756_25875 [Polyangiaceae bacterium]